jgi:hypothetical protein
MGRLRASINDARAGGATRTFRAPTPTANGRGTHRRPLSSRCNHRPPARHGPSPPPSPLGAAPVNLPWTSRSTSFPAQAPVLDSPPLPARPALPGARSASSAVASSRVSRGAEAPPNPPAGVDAYPVVPPRLRPASGRLLLRRSRPSVHRPARA